MIYLGPLALLLLALVLVPWPAHVAVGLAALAWAFIASRYFWPRWQTKRSIAFYSHGWAVIPQGALIDPSRVYGTIAEAIAFWTNLLGPLGDVGGGGVIAVYVSTTGITDVRFPEIGPAHGLTSGNNIRLAFDPGRVDHFYAVLAHETAHAIANHVGYQGDHHDYFRQVGFFF